ncbi:MAG: biotin/lipoyl-binding protein, partial [Cyanobacteria bacterium J06649_11]
MAFDTRKAKTQENENVAGIHERSVTDLSVNLSDNKKRKGKRWLIGLVLAIGASITGFVYLVNRHLTEQRQTDVAALTEEIEESTITVRISASGIVQPVRSVNISPKVAGRVSKLFVEQGDIVKEGQLIAQMENADLQAQVQEAAATLEIEKARLDELETGNRRQDIAAAEANVSRQAA